jgi:hypothetical protein
MNLQKALSKKTSKVTAQNSRILIRVRLSEVRIRGAGSGSVPKCRGSTTLQTSLAGSDSHEFISFPGLIKGHESGKELRDIFLVFQS